MDQLKDQFLEDDDIWAC